MKINYIPPDDVKVAIFFGGPSSERDISLDSARTFYEAIRFLLPSQNAISLIFIEMDGRFTFLEDSWIYCNTIDDIVLSRKVDEESNNSQLNDKQLVEQLTPFTALFSFVHGAYGEDGRLEAILRTHGCSKPLLGSSGAVQALLYDKLDTLIALRNIGYPTASYLLVNSNSDYHSDVAAFLEQHARVVVKPRRGGSSDGVTLGNAKNIETCLERALRFDTEALIESFIVGREFSLIVLQDTDGTPVPLLPTEILVSDGSNPIYTRLKKYMPGSGASHDTPANFPPAATNRIRSEACKIFEALGLEDWARFDGFLAPDGQVYWSDLNGVPGFGIDSLMFQQASIFGLDQTNLSRHLLDRALIKGGLSLPRDIGINHQRRPIFVFGGGNTSERQVSRMSWLNVIQKLSFTQRYDIHAIFVDQNRALWEVPPFVTLQHTVEEIDYILTHSQRYVSAASQAQELLGGTKGTLRSLSRASMQFEPRRTDLNEIAGQTDDVFIALHGGWGENGQLQTELDQLGIHYNGSGPQASNLCMDKHATARALDTLKIKNFRGARNSVLTFRELFSVLNTEKIGRDIAAGHTWKMVAQKYDLAAFRDQVMNSAREWQRSLGSNGLVLKPLGDGCSSGVFLWKGFDDSICAYILAALCSVNAVSWNYFGGDLQVVPDEITLKLPYAKTNDMLIEELHSTTDAADLVELTVAVYGKRGEMIALLPSETRKEFDLLTLEEKFCKGVGINVTPPPALKLAIINSIRNRVAQFANGIALEGYARIDLMFYPKNDELVLIEVNSLPGLSAATVTFTQALLTEGMKKAPSEFLEALINIKRH